MLYPKIGSVLEPKRGRPGLEPVEVRMIHRPDRMVTITPRRTVKLSQLRRDYRLGADLVS